jgi:hypothetical protein
VAFDTITSDDIGNRKPLANLCASTLGIFAMVYRPNCQCPACIGARFARAGITRCSTNRALAHKTLLLLFVFVTSLYHDTLCRLTL